MTNVPAVVDTRLRDCDALVASFRQVPYNPVKPLRPGYGTKGRAIVVRSNFFPVQIPKDLAMYEYKITVKPDELPYPKPTEAQSGRGGRGGRSGGQREVDNKLKSEEIARIMALLEDHPQFQPHVPYIAHDKRQQLISSRLLPLPLEVPVTWCYEGETQPRAEAKVYTVTITFVKELSSSVLAQ